MKYLITLKYDGSNFYGFQRLNNKRTVQGELEHVLSILNNKMVEIKGAGRTDRGVHALGQCASFNFDIDIKKDRLIKVVNDMLPNDIYVTSIMEVDGDFHARFNTIKKEYVYKVNIGEFDPFISNYTYYFPYKLDIDKMIECSKYLIGAHNFKNFVSGDRDNYNCVIHDIDFNINDNILEIKFVGKSFYRYMVRNLVGALLDVGRERASISDVVNMLEYPDVDKRLSCAPPNGLYLVKIWYN